MRTLAEISYDTLRRRRDEALAPLEAELRLEGRLRPIAEEIRRSTRLPAN